MAKLFNASEAASIAIHAMAMIANADGKTVRTREIAEKYGVSEAHLAKVLNRLSKQGLIEATRGPKGGLLLAKPSDEINLMEIYEAIEGPIELSKCMFGLKVCDGQGCILGSFFKKIADEVEQMMANTKLSQIGMSMKGE